MEKNRIGSVIRKIRRDKDLFQQDIAEKVGCTQSYLSAIENNSTETALVKRVIDVLDVMGHKLVVKPSKKVNKDDIVLNK